MENTNDELFFQLLDQFMKMSQPGFDNWEKTQLQWSSFKTLISKRPIDYNQVFNFICKMQESETSTAADAAAQPAGYFPQYSANILETGSSSRSNNFLKSTQSQSGSTLQTANFKANEGSSQRTAENTERSSDLFAPNNAYMFKTAAASIQTNHNNQSNKKEDTSREQQPHKSLNGDILGNSSALTQKTNHRASFNGGASPQIMNASNTNNTLNGGALGFKGKAAAGGGNMNIKSDKDKESSNEFVSLTSNALGQSQSTLSGKTNNTNLSTQKNTHTNYQQTAVQGNGHHTRDMRSDPTCGEDQNMLYTMKSFDQFLRQHTRIHLGSNKATFTNTSVLQLRQDQNTLLKFVAVSLFVNILSELPHPESPTESSCTSSKAFLIEIFLKVYNKKLSISSGPLQSVNSADSMYNSLTKNLGQLLQLYCLHGQSPGKLVRTFLHQIQSDAAFLDSLSALMKNLVGEFVEESEYETIAWFLNQQQQQQQQNVSMASTCASISQFNDKSSEKERRMKLGSKLRTSEWTAVKAEWLFLLSLALQRPIELFNLRDNKLEQTLFKSKKMVVSPVVFNNKINILTLTPLAPSQSLQTYYLLTMSEGELDVYSQAISKKTGKLDLRLSEEVNFTYLLKHLNYQPVASSPKHNPISAAAVGNSVNVVVPPVSAAAQPQYSPLVTQFKESASKEREYSLGHRSSKLGSHFNSTQDSNKPLQHQIHNSSVDEQSDLKSLNHKNIIQPGFQPQPAINSTATAGASQNPQNLTPRVQAFVLSPSSMPQHLQQQQQMPTYSPDPKLSLGGAFGRLQTGTLNNHNTHKSAATYLNQKTYPTSVNPADDWNKTALNAKVKDMLFKLNINTEQLNHLAKFPLSSSTPANGSSNPGNPGLQSKENIHPKSPLKYKSVLYPINQQPSTAQTSNSTSSLASFPFSSYLPQSSQAPASTTLGSNPFGISSTTHGIGQSNNINTSYTSGVSSANNFGMNYLTSENRQQQQFQQTPNNINTLNMLHSNQIGSLSPTPALTQNNQLSSSSNAGTFTSSFQKTTNSINNNPHSFLGVGNFAFSSAGSMNTGGNGPSSLSTAGSFKRHPNNINSSNNNNNNNNHYNIGNSEFQQRDILHKLSPRRNLNTQY